MPLNQEEAAPVAVEEVQTEHVEKEPEPTPEAPEGEKPEGKKTDDSSARDYVRERMQKRIDRLTYKAAQLEERLKSSLPKSEPAGEKALDRAQFESEDDYVEALVEARLQRKEAEKQQKSYAERVGSIIAEAKKLGDFDEEDFAEVPITSTMAEAIVDSDISAKLAKHFHDSPEDAERISKLSPARQAAEIGKLEDKLSQDPKPAPKTAAPEPIKPVAGNGRASVGYNPSWSMEQYRDWRKAQKRG